MEMTECHIFVRPVQSLNNPGRFCLYNVREGFYFGAAGTFEEVKERAAKENERNCEFEKIRLGHIKGA